MSKKNKEKKTDKMLNGRTFGNASIHAIKRNKIENTVTEQKITISTCRFEQIHEKRQITHQMLQTFISIL